MPQASANQSLDIVNTTAKEELPAPANDQSDLASECMVHDIRERIAWVEEKCSDPPEALDDRFDRLVDQFKTTETPRKQPPQDNQKTKRSDYWKLRVRSGQLVAAKLAEHTEALAEFLKKFDQDFASLERSEKKLELLKEKYIALADEYDQKVSANSELKDRVQLLETRLGSLAGVLEATQSGVKELESIVESRNQEIADCRRQLSMSKRSGPKD